MTIPAELSTQISVPDGTIDFGIGQPQIAKLPLTQLRAAAEHRLAVGDRHWLNYGPEAGDGPFRRVLGQFLTGHYGLPISAENLFITGGASHGLELLCDILTQPGDTILIEEPSYFLALDIFRDHGLNMVPVATDAGGLLPDALREAAREHDAKFLYTIPTYHNPTGRSISAERRQKIVDIAADCDFTIVADEVYQLLGYDGPPPVSFANWLDSGRVISIGSFSKIMAPGLRVGWFITDPKRQSAIAARGVNVSGGGFNHFTANILRSAIELGLQQSYLDELTRRYRDGRDAMAAALTQHMPPQVQWDVPEGGFFFWLTFSDGTHTPELRQRSDAFDVRFHPGTRFSAESGLSNALRLCFAFYDPPDLVKGVERLAKLIG